MAGMDVKGIGLDRDVLDKIFYCNFLKRVGSEPCKIDIEALSAYIKKYESLLTNETNRIPMLEECKARHLI